MGGTGKTPFVIALCRSLRGMGFRVGVVSRGYRRRGGGELLVCDGERILATPEEAGDEPYLIAYEARVPVAVGKNRHSAYRLLGEFSLDVVVLDDGFQHLQLERDLDICLVDGVRGFGNGWLFPSGPLREPVCGVRRAHAVVFTKGFAPGLLAECRGAFSRPVFFWPYKVELGELPEEVVVVAGVGDPSWLLRQLEGRVRIVEKRIFPDHHLYREGDFDGIEAPVVTTLKDYVKFPLSVLERLSVFVVRVDYTLPSGFLEFLRERLCP